MSRIKIRCAIYTRKSSDEGLEQEFNSLDAQHEACAAYIASQKHEGWKLANARYDDGGVSGGTLERPGLQALLADIDAGLIQMVVVYKIDRLTRSLADFSKIVERLEAAGASFVSVTQSFNTATSMGRLTLNMLLSFAQFEREVTAERIRDKIAASKKKGMWMGGMVPLGYDAVQTGAKRRLAINTQEALIITGLFELYNQYTCLRRVEEAATHNGWRSKRHCFASGKTRGGGVLTRGAIHKILTNPIYIGQIRHRDQTYSGQHDAIIDMALWEHVQTKLQATSQKRRGSPDCSNSPAPLKGKLFDETGDMLTPTHTRKTGRILRYYISNRLIKAKDPSGWRLPAKQLETALAGALSSHLTGPKFRAALAEQTGHMETGLHTQSQFAEQDTSNILRLIARADLSQDKISVTLEPEQFTTSIPDDLLSLQLPLRIRRRGQEQKLIFGDNVPTPDPNLAKTLADAHHWLKQIKSGTPLAQIAGAEGKPQSYIRKRLKLALLSPRIQSAILKGSAPTHWTQTLFIKSTKTPADWSEQEEIWTPQTVLP